MKTLENFLEKLIFNSRWIQLPMYLGLILGSFIYSYKFFQELTHLISSVETLTHTTVMLGVLTLVDFTMVTNLIFMVILGGYSTFVSKMHFLASHEDRQEWLEKVSSGTLKVKLAGSLVGVSGIHLLQTFINMNHYQPQEVILQISIHLVFLVSTLVLAYTEKILH